MTSRDLVHQALEFRNPARAPRDLWHLPWAGMHHPAELRAILAEFPPDITRCGAHLRERPPGTGDPHAIGTSTDAWGCTFENIQAGMIGEVRDPVVTDWDAQWRSIRPPREWLSVDVDAVNRDCVATEKFVLAPVVPRPFERLQFLAGSENLMADLMDPPEGLRCFLPILRDFYGEVLSLWTRTDVDGLMVMDDWGSQQAPLINPELWNAWFRPFYEDAAQIAHSAGKKLFFHSDGHIAALYPAFVEIGIDALNSQVGCMGTERLEPFAGRITFWGEVDRQWLLPHGSLEDVRANVAEIHSRLWREGGCIAQCEFGPGAKPENVREVFAAWDDLTRAS